MLRDLCLQWLYYSIEDGGDITAPGRGIARGSALSPLIGGSLLHHMDCHLGGKEEFFYARYTDDFIIFTQARWHLRQSIRRLHDYFELGGFSPHPDKTQGGKKEYGCDWMGVWFTPAGATVAPRALANHRECCARLVSGGCPERRLRPGCVHTWYGGTTEPNSCWLLLRARRFTYKFIIVR